jgi:anti-sigma regulatory factor (Ser/Thr protein kinase)
MTVQPDRTDYLLREWRPDAVVARRFEVVGGTYAPSNARAMLEELLAERLGTDDLFDVSVLLSELVTNAVRHAGADEQATIVVHVAVAPTCLRIEVCDQGPGFQPPIVPRSRPQGGGNGLVLLARMSSDWGVATDDGTCVWFERSLAPSRGGARA